MSRLPALLLCALALGCQSTYNDDFKFTPYPAEVQAREDAPVRALASVIGVRNENQKQGVPLSVETRLQLENRGDTPVTFDPSTLRLTSGSLSRFDPPLATPPDPVTLDPGGAATVTALFPFPGQRFRAADLSGLNLEWTLTRAGDNQRFQQSANFQRRPIGYRHDDYYRRPSFGVGIGVGTVID